jgi:hypothetical protein
LSEILKPKAPYLFVVAAAFFGYLLFVVQNSFQAEYQIYMDNIASIMKGNLWSLFQVISEYSGDVGLFLRFAGACFFVAFTLILWIKGNFQLSILRKTIILEAAFYMFNIPFDINLLTRPPIGSYTQTIFHETAVSYILQMLLISTTLILLYTKMKKPSVERTELFRYGALAATAYAFSLWVKHFFFNIYALPISFSNPVLLTSFLNSTLTILTAALIIMVTLLPVIRGKTTNFNQTAFGVGLTLIGVYFIIYIILCTLNATIHAFLPLIELWAITLPVLGVAFIACARQRQTDSDRQTLGTHAGGGGDVRVRGHTYPFTRERKKERLNFNPHTGLGLQSPSLLCATRLRRGLTRRQKQTNWSICLRVACWPRTS